jgi:hypothetical protein
MENQPIIINSQKPLYLVGLLCLIPLIGAFVGLVLLLLGIIKYKDKLLIVIGTFGIVFTVSIYSFLFYYIENSEEAKNGFKEVSQMQINNLIKNIEFYKLQNGQYPDSLPQLLATDKLTPINDAIQIVKHRKSTYFTYKKIGGTYKLFSSGQDGISNTKDDIYPNTLISDSSKIGFRR